MPIRRVTQALRTRKVNPQSCASLALFPHGEAIEVGVPVPSHPEQAGVIAPHCRRVWRVSLQPGAFL